MNLPIHPEDAPACHTLDVVARLTGVHTDAILHYQESGLIGSDPYDDETVRTLRRIEHLRTTCGVNEAGLRLILGLMEELERLRSRG